MDTKWKSNKILRSIIVGIVLLVVAIVNISFFPQQVLQKNKNLEEKRKADATMEKDINTYEVETLYYGTHIFYEQIQEEKNANRTGEVGVVVPGGGESMESPEYSEYTHTAEENLLLEENYQDVYRNNFYHRGKPDYCVFQRNEAGEYIVVGTRGDREDLGKLVLLKNKEISKNVVTDLENRYDFYIMLAFDAAGNMEVEQIYDAQVGTGRMKQAFEDAHAYAKINSSVTEYPRDIKVIYALEADYYNLAHQNTWWSDEHEYALLGVQALPVLSFLFLMVFALLMRKPKVLEGRKESLFMRYPIIPIGFGTMMMITLVVVYPSLLYQFESMMYEVARYENDFYFLGYAISKEEMEMLCYVFFGSTLVGWYWISYYTMALIRPVFSMGLISYIKEKSIVIVCIRKFFKFTQKWKNEIEQIRMDKANEKKIRVVLLLNLIILSLLSFAWFFAIPFLIAYSIFLYCYIGKWYGRVKKDYSTMEEATEQIAGGNLEYQMEEEMGIYEPMREKLGRVQEGMKAAVLEEVKSQRMKTELISNVSHDLKTPLTAITTYVELLKNPHLTEEERRNYVETLEEKSIRLKNLIEDLFEVSKTASQDIVLELTEVDMVHLLKQAAVEYSEKWEAAGLQIRWDLPAEKVLLSLDSQKTYRIFDNLFGNISKYALENTRVYLTVLESEREVEISLKNISAGEFNRSEAELMERFVRGDQARNTEGSGLGLAIAKNLVEVQNGTLEVKLDGDLFKITITWKK